LIQLTVGGGRSLIARTVENAPRRARKDNDFMMGIMIKSKETSTKYLETYLHEQTKLSARCINVGIANFIGQPPISTVSVLLDSSLISTSLWKAKHAMAITSDGNWRRSIKSTLVEADSILKAVPT
jgi:hypothetical protein